MNCKLKDFINQNKFLIIFFGSALIIHIFLPLNWSDDAVFLKKAADKDIFTFLTGSARPFTDGLTYIFSRNQWLWRLLNPCVLSFLLYGISKTAMVDLKQNSTKIIILTALFPTMVLVDAGFVATTLNYLWPVTFGILNLIPLIDYINDKKSNKALLFILVPLLIYATNMQQMCAVLLAIFVLSNFYFIVKRKFKPYLLFQLIVTAVGTLSSLILNFTGDNSRIIRESERYFPSFGQLNIFEKTELGFSSTFFCMTMEMRQAFAGFFIFSVFLAFIIFKTNKSLSSKIVSLIPAVTSLFFAVLSVFLDLNCGTIDFLTGDMINYRMNKAVYSFRIVPDIYFVFLFIIIIYCICVLIENKAKKIAALSVLLFGLASRMIMGFSPTVWASGYRTYCIMFISFIYIVLIIFSDFKRNSKNELIFKDKHIMKS